MMFRNRFLRLSMRGRAVAGQPEWRRALRLKPSIGVVLATVVSTVVAATMVGQPAYANNPGTIKSYRSGLCLEPVPGPFQSVYDNGVRIAQMPCNGSAAQLWRSILLGQARSPLYKCSFGCPEIPLQGYYYLMNNLTGRCLDVKDARTEDGAVIQQFSCNGGGSEKWFKHRNNLWPQYVQYVNSRTAKCLDVPYATTSASYIWQYHCTPLNVAQEFTFPL
jgi:hypothetical protein